MYCEQCQSSNQSEFAAEIMIHVGSLKDLDSPDIPAFPKISVCLDCGFSRFVTGRVDLARLIKRRATGDLDPTQRIRVAEIALTRGLAG
jgi:hypothetical protein